jgi:sugar transferase (PEP-CTERM/EpsH1 system associated)
MGDILFLAHRIPYPPDKGDKIRSWRLLERLATLGRVHLGAFVDDPADMAHAPFLKSMCASVMLPEIRKSDRWKRSVKGWLRGDPLSVALFYDSAMVEWVRETLRRHQIDRIVVFSGQMAPYALPHLAGRKSVMDFVDIDSEKWAAYARAEHGWRRRIYKREAKLLRAAEKTATRHFGTSFFVSEDEAALFRKMAGSWASNVKAMSNGVDCGYFDPAAVVPVSPGGRPFLVFTGAMDYRPNVDAVVWFVDRVWPRIRAAAPAAEFAIVGANPAAEVIKLRGNGVAVTGRVADVRPFLAAADVAVAPLQIARGIQNKVLEAMAMARPVVATPQAFEGIEAVPGVHLLVSAKPEEIAGDILSLVADPARAQAMGQAARGHVAARYDWAATLAPLDAALAV